MEAVPSPAAGAPEGTGPRGTGPSVLVFGAGIAGLSAAHELAKRGYRVTVHEASVEAGGFFRSARLPRRAGMPSEYSWHGMGPWYHNLFDLLKDIPFDETGSLYERALSRPIDFGLFPDEGAAAFYDHGLRSIPRMFRFTTRDWILWAWLMLKAWGANRRTEERYSQVNAAAAWRPLLREKGYTTWRACFGPWIGSDWTNVSLHQAGQFFQKQLVTRPRHLHPADEDGPAWTQGAGDGWLLFRGPSSEFWFERWVRHLRAIGVELVWNSSLERFEHRDGRITAARVSSGAPVSADHYVLATTPFAAAEILARTPELERLPVLRSFRPLVEDGPHVQVSFRIGFGEEIALPRARTAVVVADSEFNLTLFAEEQVWKDEVSLGRGIRSLWTGTSCVATVPGRLFGEPVRTCTKEQFIAEVKAQILACGSLDALVREANGGRGLADFEIIEFEVWHEWEFSKSGIRGPQPKWVNTTSTQPHLPSQVTPVPNLVLAGAHTRTEADVWSIEGAVESGRRAAQAIEPTVPVIPQYRPRWIRALAALDDACYRLGAPHFIDLASLAALAGLCALIAYALL